ncbi:polyamine aminopropyltransferase [Agromyces aerolatus]|uniref:hypothetical protein n=1 Tax=Agromyces sp. LY-1074 TaxID=3074080 RepID=UPI00285E0F6A|nr:MULTISPECIES: hypothetical protein [unclassified Agromyces]MDR5698434.1 hypothetical protein [Agromyces sp. LY-1074]MDR5704728.1 hypothetical protein [Agromyces sp. LY-1358]
MRRSARCTSGAALSLPRYVEATRPGSAQVVVEHDGAMLDAVLARVPLPRDADVELVIADARVAVSEMSGARHETAVPGRERPQPEASARPSTLPFDLVVVDLYTGLEPPAFVSSPGFVRDVLAVVAADGLVIVNVADAAGLTRLGAQARAFTRIAPTAELLVAGGSPVLAGAEEGNAILVVAPGGVPADLERRLLAAGPHPAGVLTADRLDFVLWGAC